MFCKAYQERLKDAACGAGLEECARLHLATCSACAAAFAEEQALFAAIDNGVARIVSSEAPPSLLPRVREAVAQERVAPRGFVHGWVWIPVVATAALVIAVLLPRGDHHTISPPVQSVQQPSSGVQMGATPSGASAPSLFQTPERTPRRATSAHSSSVEVLVSPQEEAGLKQYAAVLRRRRDLAKALIASSGGPSMQIEPLEIASMEWPELSIKPLAEEKNGFAK